MLFCNGATAQVSQAAPAPKPTVARRPYTKASVASIVRTGAAAPRVQTLASYTPDCNDPDAHDLACTEPTPDIINSLYAAGYPYYIGHAEPTVLFFSTVGASGSNMRWKLKLPATDPSPTQNGSSVANFELYSTFWIGLALCDPNSRPYGGCIAASDTNIPSTAGAGFLELQFYPPGINCSNTQWCVNLHINTLQDRNATQIMNCNEPTTAAYVTTDGTPGGPKLLMNNGDTIIVTIHDTANGLETDVNDVTTSTTGSMVASGANGFVHNANQTDCSTAPFDFHAMYATASPGQVVPWASLQPNVSLDFEIGHWELCTDSTCSAGHLPDNDSDDTGCGTTRGIGGCTDKDSDHDGTSYQADWPDGTSVHPATLILKNPTDTGVGPFSAATGASTTYDEPYGTIRFRTTESTTAPFYPFYSLAGTGTACVFNFGNDIPGTTLNDFGKATQFGTGTTMPNPCAGSPPVISKSFGAASIPLGQSTSLSFTISNPNATLALTGVAFNDTLPAGLVISTPNGLSSTCGGTVTASAGSSSLSLVSGTLAGGGSCTIAVNVTGATAGVKNNVSGNVTANESSSAGNQATASITVVAPPQLTKTFAGVSVPLHQNINLTFLIMNPNATTALTGIGFSDTLPAGLIIATPNGLIGSCGGGTITAVAGSSSITLSNATLAASASCTFTVSVTGITAGSWMNTTSVVTSNQGGSGPPASATVAVLAPPTISKAFGDSELELLGPGNSTSLSFTLANPPANPLSLTGVGFTDNLPAGLIVSTPNGLTGSCGGGVITAADGSNTISLSGATLAVGSSCTFSVQVTAIAIGEQDNTTSPVTSTNGGTGLPASASTSIVDLFFIWFFS